MTIIAIWSADELMAMALEAKHRAELQIRIQHHDRWHRFYKCRTCGDSAPVWRDGDQEHSWVLTGSGDEYPLCPNGHGPEEPTGYQGPTIPGRQVEP